jgi:hypothetical protein
VALSNPFQRLLVIVLAAWVSLCCCEKRMLADAIGGHAETARGCCERDCCGDDDDKVTDDATHRGSGNHEQDHGKPGCCADGCCAKAAPSSASFTLDFDQIGCALPPSFEPCAPMPTAGRVLSHEDRAVGEPPPRLGLIISRRLRI